MNIRHGRFIKRRAMLIISLFLVVLSTGSSTISCYSQPAPQAPASAPAKETASGAASTGEVTIEGFAFKPAEIAVRAGGTIVWQNRDSVPHTVTARDKTFDSSSLSRGSSFSYTFKQKGTFEYYCGFHPSMTGKVVVE